MTWMRLRRSPTEAQPPELGRTPREALPLQLDQRSDWHAAPPAPQGTEDTKITSFSKLQLDFKLCSDGEEEEMFTEAFNIS